MIPLLPFYFFIYSYILLQKNLISSKIQHFYKITFITIIQICFLFKSMNGGIVIRNPFGRTIFGFLLLLIVSFSFTMGAGAYKTATTNESAQFQADVTSLNNAPILLDLANQGLAKSFIQPGLVQISTGHGGGGITNQGEEPLPIQVKLVNFPDDTELTLQTAADNKTGKLYAPLAPGALFGMAIVTKIPKEDRQQLISVTGEIQFLHADNGSLLGKVPVYIVNSKYGNPQEKLGIKEDNANLEKTGQPQGGCH